MSIFEKFVLDNIFVTLLTKHHMIKAEQAQHKVETVQSDIVRYYPRSKLPFRVIKFMLQIVYLSLAVHLFGFTIQLALLRVLT